MMAHVSFPKPVRGSFRRERHERRTADATYLKAQKAIAKARDGGKCRWPHCACKRGAYKAVLESAHLVDKSLGGSDDASNLVTLCDERHRGNPSLHSKDLHIEPLTSDGANGPCAFYRRDESGRPECVGVERLIGISEARRA